MHKFLDMYCILSIPLLSGRSPALLTRDRFLSGMKDGRLKPEWKGLQATVPGAVKAWFEIIKHFGSGKVGKVKELAHIFFFLQSVSGFDNVKNSISKALFFGRKHGLLLLLSIPVAASHSRDQIGLSPSF